MTYETLLVQRTGALARITINRPAVLNALNAQVIQELSDFLNDELSTRDLRALVLTGAGDKAFIAGADIAAMQKLTPVGALNRPANGRPLRGRRGQPGRRGISVWGDERTRVVRWTVRR
jgi:enoyl-CoA hydratase/carnithine racemase